MVAQEAGLSEHKARTAVNIAAIPEADFEAAVESSRPPGTTILSQWNKLNRPERVHTVTENSLADTLRSARARSVVGAMLQLERYAECGPAAVIEILLDPANVEKLERVRRAIRFAILLKGALDQKGLRGNLTLRLIHADE